ncbi:MAG TPA: zf-TFIIB domain-containing protein [Pyrinomonadaceae bacterium]|nr:zf-TFIIB domain-containing protein [Pyrinomonadaceae bacterium]
MDAGTINCPMCGAATSSDSPRCRYCEAILATVACPSCFAMMFSGSKHCPRCGASAERGDELIARDKNCPRCRSELQMKTVGNEKVLECNGCGGLWLPTESFEKICVDKERQSAVLGTASLAPLDRETLQAKVSYVPCPECSQLMNRANFARCSGVIIDVCKKHGVWFDRDELSRIVEFIRSGGLELSRAKEKTALEEERRRVHQEPIAFDILRSPSGDVNDSDRLSGIASAGALLKLLLG